MSEQDTSTAVEESLNDAENGYLHVLLSDEAARNLPARIFLKEGPAFVISPRMELPAFLHDGENRLVVISAAEHRELVVARSQLLRHGLADAKAARKPAVRLGLSTIERDQEVASFLRERFHGGITVTQLHDDCLKHFGTKRTPSIQRIQRFRQNFRL